jgi:predicted nucleotidyltransferase
MGSSNLHPSVLRGGALRLAIRESVGRCLDIERHQLFIFGSEASGVADRSSDIDIGILGPRPVPGAVMQTVRQALDTLRTLRSFDVVDLSVVDEGFRAEALEHAERL